MGNILLLFLLRNLDLQQNFTSQFGLVYLYLLWSFIAIQIFVLVFPSQLFLTTIQHTSRYMMLIVKHLSRLILIDVLQCIDLNLPEYGLMHERLLLRSIFTILLAHFIIGSGKIKEFLWHFKHTVVVHLELSFAFGALLSAPTKWKGLEIAWWLVLMD
jgi:hypothetical protein